MRGLGRLPPSGGGGVSFPDVGLGSVELGIREWSQQTKSEEAKEGQTLIRYILQGSGTVAVTVAGSVGNNNQPKKFNTGMLLEVEGPVLLEWNINKDDEGGDVIILTPGYENTSLFVGAIVGFVAMVGALSGGFELMHG